MEKGGDQGFDFENYYKVLSIKYESLIREDSEARKNGENEKLNPEQSVMVIATTYFPEFDPEDRESSDSVRGTLALESINRLNKKGINVSIVDGGSSPLFTQMVSEINPRRFSEETTTRQAATVVDSVNLLEVTKESRESGEKMPGLIWLLEQKKRGYSQARIEAIKNVTDIIVDDEGSRHLKNGDALIQVEIEKTQLVAEVFNITRPINEGKADIVIPDRGIRVKELGDKHDDFRGYPEFQAVSERKANLEIHRMLVEAGLRKKKDSVLDLFGGTRALKNTSELRSLFGETFEIPENSPFWGKVKPEAYSNAVYFPIYVSLSLNKKVVSVPIEFSYPKEQSELEKKNDEEFASKRKRQFDDIVTGSNLLIDFLGKEKGNGGVGRKKTSDEVLQRLKKASVLKLEELEWTDENEFNEKYFYKGGASLSLIEKSVTDENVVSLMDRALKSYFSKLNADSIAPNDEKFEKIKETMTLLKSEIEKRGKTEEIEKIYLKYHEPALKNLKETVKLFYMLRQSEVSRNLDIASFLVEAVNVPKYGYIKAVLLSTPNDGIAREFDNLTKDFKISDDEKAEMVHRFSRETLQKAIASGKEKWLEGVRKGLEDIFNLSPEEVKNIEEEIQARK